MALAPVCLLNSSFLPLTKYTLPSLIVMVTYGDGSKLNINSVTPVYIYQYAVLPNMSS